MTQWDWSPYLVGGATRPDALTGLDPAFLGSLQGLFSSAPPEIQGQLRMLSGYRSPERQQQLWDEALAKYGSAEAARKWVAPPGRSFHNKGSAVDLRYLDDTAREWAHQNAQAHGLHFPLSNEPWHIEPIGLRSGTTTQPQGSPTQGAASQSPQGVLGAVGGGSTQPPAQGLLAKIFGTTDEKVGGFAEALSGLAPPEQQPMQAPQVKVGPGYQKQGDSLSRALESFAALRANRRI